MQCICIGSNRIFKGIPLKESEFVVKESEFVVKESEFVVKESESAVTLLDHRTYACVLNMLL